MNIIEPLPRNVFEISGSEVNNTCIFDGDNGQLPVRVKFQRRKEVGLDWFDIPDTERVYQTNKTEGETWDHLFDLFRLTMHSQSERWNI